MGIILLIIRSFCMHNLFLLLICVSWGFLSLLACKYLQLSRRFTFDTTNGETSVFGLVLGSSTLSPTFASFTFESHGLVTCQESWSSTSIHFSNLAHQIANFLLGTF